MLDSFRLYRIMSSIVAAGLGLGLIGAAACKQKIKAQFENSASNRDVLKVVHFNMLSKSMEDNWNHWFLETHASPGSTFEISPDEFSEIIRETTSKTSSNDTGKKYSFTEWRRKCEGTNPLPYCGEPEYSKYKAYPALVSALDKTQKSFFDWSARQPRMKAVLDSMILEKADVISLAEVDTMDWLQPLFEKAGYALLFMARTQVAGTETTDGTALVYRRDRLTLDETTLCKIAFSEGGATASKGVGIAAQFTLAESGFRFWALSTHLHKIPNGEKEEKIRVEELSQLINRRCKFDGAPKILLGDLNAGPGSSTLETLDAAGYRNALLPLDRPGTLTSEVVHPCTTSTRERQMWIDHIYWKGDELVPMRPLERFPLVSCGPKTRWPDSKVPSDHVPISMAFKVRPPQDVGK